MTRAPTIGFWAVPYAVDYFIKNRESALQLGKALFWDMQVDSDGVQASRMMGSPPSEPARSRPLARKGPVAP
jgi:hypothetical protein